MKKFMLLIILFIPFQLHAACKCNCNLGDLTICASSYDLDNPCPAQCPAAAPGLAPMYTATYPPTSVYNPITKQNEFFRAIYKEDLEKASK